MKIKKEQLITLLKNSTKSEFSLSDIIELTEEDIPQEAKTPYASFVNGSLELNHPEEDYLHEGDYERPNRTSVNNSGDLKPETANYTSSDDYKRLKALHPNVQYMLDNGYIRDPKYIQVLARTKTYMEYLEENPALFLEKRIEWKLNKLIGMTSYNVIAKGMYVGTTEEITDSQSVRDLEALLLERLHIPRERLTKDPVLNLVYLLDAYGVDKLKVIFFLIRSCYTTKHFFAESKSMSAIPRIIKNVPLRSGDIIEILDDICTGFKMDIRDLDYIPDHMRKVCGEMIDILDIDKLEAYLGIPNAVAGNLIDPLAHTYAERALAVKHYNRLQTGVRNIETQDYNKFKKVYNLLTELSPRYNIMIPYRLTLKASFDNRRFFTRIYKELVYEVLDTIEKI